MTNFTLVTPRFSDFNQQGLLKASTHLDLACEAQLEQMEPRYNLPLSVFVERKQRWHIADFKISYPKPVKARVPIRIEADVVRVEESTMTVAFSFLNEHREVKHAFGEIIFELVGVDDCPVSIWKEARESLIANGKLK